MTRYRLIRLARLSAAALGLLILGAGIRGLGLSATVRVVAVCALAGAAASAGWHIVALGAGRREEQLLAERRHRAPRPDRAERRQPAAELAPEPGPDVDAAVPAATVDPYAEEYSRPGEQFGFDADGWFGPAEDDLYAHHPAGTA